MLSQFLDRNRVELAERCRQKVAARRSPGSTADELDYGVPTLIGQLVELLRSNGTAGTRIESSQLPVGIGRSATIHGRDLLRKGFTVDQVVHDYGDLCQAVTELAHEKHEAISVEEFHTFNRCLDAAIAYAVLEFGNQRDQLVAERGTRTISEQLGSLAHEQRNLLNTATLAYAAIKTGRVAVTGATGAILDRSLEGLRILMDRALAGVRVSTGLHPIPVLTPLGMILEEASVAAQLEADARGIRFSVVLASELSVKVDRQMLSSAIANLLQNAFKFTPSGGHVVLSAGAREGHVEIEIADECGGLPSGNPEELFRAFEQRGTDRSGVGLGLSISRRAVEANGGTLRVRDVPDKGCVFTIDFRRD